ncbi:MAG TPA: hypothetical protein VK364_13225 [Hymenobacter sp.]|nr:hypothetical protein [Hymenobacter sp.]
MAQVIVRAFYLNKEYNIHFMPGLLIQFKRDGQSYKWQSTRITNRVEPISVVYGGHPQV